MAPKEQASQSSTAATPFTIPASLWCDEEALEFPGRISRRVHSVLPALCRPRRPPDSGHKPRCHIDTGCRSHDFDTDKTTARLAGEFYSNATHVIGGAEAIGACVGLNVLPEDIAEAVWYLASSASARSTGNIVNVDAGNAQALTR